MKKNFQIKKEDKNIKLLNFCNYFSFVIIKSIVNNFTDLSKIMTLIFIE